MDGAGAASWPEWMQAARAAAMYAAMRVVLCVVFPPVVLVLMADRVDP